jgi:hypothetical protein
MATTGYGISHKDTKYTDKWSNNRTNKMMKPQMNTFSRYCEESTQKENFGIKVYTYYTRYVYGGLTHILDSISISE